MVNIELHKKLRSGMRLVDFSFKEELSAGEVLGITGPSGCGKSSLLSMISGLLPAEQSRISVGDVVVEDTSTNILLRAGERKVMQVFQKPLLFPNMTLLQHIDYVKDKDLDFDLAYFMEAFELLDFTTVKPAFLSGGQIQRLALLMALSTNFSLLLLDEVFTGLDQRLKSVLIPLLVKEVKRREKALILVSHDLHILSEYTDRILTFPAL